MNEDRNKRVGDMIGRLRGLGGNLVVRKEVRDATNGAADMLMELNLLLRDREDALYGIRDSTHRSAVALRGIAARSLE